MKTLFCTILLAFLGVQLSFAQVGIGTTTPDPNAALDIESTSQGVLIPRMLKSQRELIGGGSPAAGMLVYQTDDVAGFYFYNGTAWVSLSAKTPSGLESIDEGNGNGLVRVGRDPANYGNVGENAVDLSHSNTASTTYGATNDYSTAMGWQTEASGTYSTAMGSFTTAIGQYSTAMGWQTEALGGLSTAMGWQTTALGNYSTAMGYQTEGFGDVSTALGSFTTAFGDVSTALGLDTQAESYASTAIGLYNVGGGNPISFRTTDPLFEIGNGTSDSNRSNALTVLKNGNVGIGTTTPSQALDVIGNAEINGAAIVTNNLQVDNTTLFVNASNNRVGIGTTDPLQALSVVGNAEVTGSLGLGTASPIAKLDVNGNAYVNGNVGIGATNPSDKLVIEGGRLEVLADIDASGLPGTGSIEVANSLRIDRNEIITNTDSPLFLQQGNNGNLIVDNGTLVVDSFYNRVGIGTSSPSQALHVIGNAEINGSVSANGLVLGQRVAFTGFQDADVTLGNSSPTLSLVFSDVTDNFNTLNSGVFTAPLSGLYFFSCSLSFSEGDGLDDTMWFGFSVNGSSGMVTESIFNPRTYTSGGREQAYSHSAVISLNTGDTVEVLIRDISTTSPVEVLDRTFTGYYLGGN